MFMILKQSLLFYLLPILVSALNSVAVIPSLQEHSSGQTVIEYYWKCSDNDILYFLG